LDHRFLRYERFQWSLRTQELVSVEAKSCSTNGLVLGRRKTFSMSVRFLQYFLQYQANIGSCWKHSFTVYRIVSYHEPVWKLCQRGDISGLQQLFSEGVCSPFVTMEDGWTLIHVRIIASIPWICLIMMGSRRQQIANRWKPLCFLLNLASIPI